MQPENLTTTVNTDTHSPSPRGFELAVEVDAVGPFSQLTHIGTIKPGVNLLRGPNGAGKSTIARLIETAAKKRLAVGDISINDDRTGSTAMVKIGPATMRARLGRRPVREGELQQEVEPLPSPIAILEHGNHCVGEDAAFRARFSALLKWLGVEISDPIRVEIAGQDPALREWSAAEGSDIDDLWEYTRKARETAQAHRRSAERDLSSAEAELASREGRCAQVLEDASASRDEVSAALPLDVAKDKLSAAREQVSTLRARRQACMDEQARRAKLSETHGEPPDVSAALVKAEEAKVAQTQAETDLRSKRDAVEALRQQLSQAEADEKVAQKIHEASALATREAEKRLDQVRHERTRHDEITAQLAEEIHGPTPQEVDAAEESTRKAEHGVQVAEAADRYRRVATTVEEQRTAVEQAKERVELYDAEAAAIWERLANVVNRVLDSDLIRLHGETIEIQVNGTWRDISDDARVSEGQRTRICYDLLLRHRSGERVIMVEGATKIDPAVLEEVGAEAARRGIALILETPDVTDDGSQLTLEHYGCLEVA